jgi:hypothetical protein
MAKRQPKIEQQSWMLDERIAHLGYTLTPLEQTLVRCYGVADYIEHHLSEPPKQPFLSGELLKSFDRAIIKVVLSRMERQVRAHLAPEGKTP